MSDEMTGADVLDAAADYLRVHGWQQGRLGNVEAGGPCCVWGATYTATGANNLCAADRALAKFVRVRPGDLWKWNDAPERTADEVIDALMSCAADLRLRGAP